MLAADTPARMEHCTLEAGPTERGTIMSHQSCSGACLVLAAPRRRRTPSSGWSTRSHAPVVTFQPVILHAANKGRRWWASAGTGAARCLACTPWGPGLLPGALESASQGLAEARQPLTAPLRARALSENSEASCRILCAFRACNGGAITSGCRHIDPRLFVVVQYR